MWSLRTPASSTRTSTVRPPSVSCTSAFGLKEPRRAWLVIGKLSSANMRSNSRNKSSGYIGLCIPRVLGGTSCSTWGHGGPAQRRVAAHRLRYARVEPESGLLSSVSWLRTTDEVSELTIFAEVRPEQQTALLM